MKLVRSFLAAIGLLLAAASPAFAQGAGCLPTSGTFSGLQEQEYINAAVAVLLNNGLGASQPGIGCSGNPVTGELYMNSSQSGYIAVSLFDGERFNTLGTLDIVNHIWMASEAGGIGTLSSAATVDPCSIPQNSITITGTTNITSFNSNCGVGQIKYLAFQGTLVITENASYILTPDGLSITTSSADRITIMYTGGGIWQVLSRQSGNIMAAVGQVLVSSRTDGNPDPGTLLENGQCVSQATYPALYARDGTNWGGTSCPSGEFAVPDMGGRTIYGLDTTSADRLTAKGFGASDTVIGNVGGLEKMVVAQANLASFTMTGTLSGTATGSATYPSANIWVDNNAGSQSFNPGYSSMTLVGSLNVSVNLDKGIPTVNSGGSSTPLPTASPGAINLLEVRY